MSKNKNDISGIEVRSFENYTYIINTTCILKDEIRGIKDEIKELKDTMEELKDEISKSKTAENGTHEEFRNENIAVETDEKAGEKVRSSLESGNSTNILLWIIIPTCAVYLIKNIYSCYCFARKIRKTVGKRTLYTCTADPTMLA